MGKPLEKDLQMLGFPHLFLHVYDGGFHSFTWAACSTEFRSRSVNTSPFLTCWKPLEKPFFCGGQQGRP